MAQLVAPGGTAMTCNIEYNQLDPLLRAVQRLEGKPETGDTALGDADVSPFPGNINILVIDLTRYTATLSPTDGIIPEFVNPKYVDGSRTSFKSPTRLECMMQVRRPGCGQGCHAGCGGGEEVYGALGSGAFSWGGGGDALASLGTMGLCM